MTKYLTKGQIQSVEDVPYQDVEVPEWGGMVRVRGLTGTERDAMEASMVEGKGKKADVNLANLRAKLCARCMVDDNGKRLFNDMEIPELGRKSAKALERVFSVARELSGLSDEDIDELTKNSDEGQSE